MDKFDILYELENQWDLFRDIYLNDELTNEVEAEDEVRAADDSRVSGRIDEDTDALYIEITPEE